MTIKYNTHAILQRGECHVQNTAHTMEDGTLKAAYCDLTAAEYCAEKNANLKPGEAEFEIVMFDDAMPLLQTAQREKYLSDWTEIEEEQWMDALEVLPPEKWRTVAGVEIFRMCEYLTGTITAHYARIGKHYFTANRCARTSYDEIAEEVATASRETIAALLVASNCD
jgi:hypothetical protein